MRLVYLALVLIQVLFGINYVVTKVVVGQVPPLVWASVRLIVCAAVMMTVCFLSRKPSRPRLDRKFLLPLIGLAIFGMIVNQGSFLVGLRYTTATNSAILNTLIPIFTLLLVTIRGQEPLTGRRALGFLFAFAGVLAMRRVEDLSFSNKTLIGDLLMVVNGLSYSIFLSFGKKFMERHDRVWTTAFLFAYGSVGLTFFALPSYMELQLPQLTPLLLGCMVFAVVGGTLTTYFLNVWTLAQIPSSTVAIFIYIQPVVAASLAWAWMGEAPSLRSSVSAVFIFTGLLLALFGDRIRRPVQVAGSVSTAGTLR